MNSPESNEALTFHDQPDKFDELSAVFCRLGIERLLQEARLFGELLDSEEGGVKVCVEITEPKEAAEATKHTRELVEIKATIDEEFQRYGIKHAVYVRSEDAKYDLYLLRLYDFVFSADTINGSDKLIFNTDFSSTCVQLNHIKTDAEGVTRIYNEGGPLSTKQNEMLEALIDDTDTIKDHQFFEVKDLTRRALNSVRAEA